MRTACQWILTVLTVISTLRLLYQDINGRKATDPTGFVGVVTTLVITIAVGFIYYGAGVFDSLAGR